MEMNSMANLPVRRPAAGTTKSEASPSWVGEENNSGGRLHRNTTVVLPLKPFGF